MANPEIKRSERAKRGAVLGAIGGFTIATAGTILAVATHQADFANEMAKNQMEVIETVGLFISLHTILWSGLGSLMDGLVIPEINRKFDKLDQWLEQRLQK